VPVELTWNAPAECPTRDAVVDEVARVLTASHESRVQVDARVDISRDDQGRWHAALSLATRDAHSSRVLDAESCPAIASATAVIIAIAVEGGLPEPTPPAAAPSTRPPSIHVSTPPREFPSQLIVTAAATVDAGMLQSPAPGVEAALGWAYSLPRWRIRAAASGSFFLPQDSGLVTCTRSSSGPCPAVGESGHFNLFAAAARVCGSIVEQAFDLGPCLGVEIDVMNGAGEGPAQSIRSTGVWPSALASLLASWSFSRHLAITARAEGFYAPKPVQFVLNYVPATSDHILVYQPSPTGARGALGVEVRFF
jgi:hypothetical protein